MPKRPPTRQAPPRARLEGWLADGVARMGLTLTAQQTGQFLLYLDLLQRWGGKINLTASLDPQNIIDRHFCDSLALWGAEAPASNGRLLDVGAGAGFPGVPLKLLAPSISLTLLEPRQKRAAFLQVLITELGLTSSHVATERLADLPAGNPFTWIAARGVGRLAQFVEQATPHLAPGGRIALYLSDQQPSRELERLTDYQTTEHRYRLPFSQKEYRLLLLHRR